MSVQPERSYRGRSAADRRADRRARFLDAALAVFAERSYANSSVSDVCAAAGLSRRQFYEEFASREVLLVELYDEIQRDARAALVAGLGEVAATDLESIAVAAMTAYVRSIGSDPRRAKIAFVEIVGVNPEIERHRLASRAAWAGLFESVVRSLEGATTEPRGGFEMAATAFIGAVNGLVHQWSITDPRPPVTDLVGVLTTVLVALASTGA